MIGLRRGHRRGLGRGAACGYRVVLGAKLALTTTMAGNSTAARFPPTEVLLMAVFGVVFVIAVVIGLWCYCQRTPGERYDEESPRENTPTAEEQERRTKRSPHSKATSQNLQSSALKQTR